MDLLTTPPGSDADLIGRVLSGDRPAFGELLRRYDRGLRAVVYRMLGGDRDRMDDVLQETYLRAFKALGGFRREADIGTWLHRIATNACLDELRRDRRRPAPLPEPREQDEASPGAGPDRVVGAADELLQLLGRLPDDQRAAVLLVDGEGFDYRAAGEILGVPSGTVASRLSRARATLRAAIEEDR